MIRRPPRSTRTDTLFPYLRLFRATAHSAPAAPGLAVINGVARKEERVRMTRVRQTIAARLKEAQNTAAMLTTFNDVDMTAVMDARNRYKDLFEKKHGLRSEERRVGKEGSSTYRSRW